MASVKICGLSTAETVAAAADGGAAFLGFNFYPRSPRAVTPEAAARLAEPVRGRGIKLVAIVVDPDDALIDAIAAHLKPDLVQFHGHETPARVREASARAGVGAIKAIAISEAADFDAAPAFEPVVEHLLFDARPPKDAALPGGVGARFEWSLLAGRRYARPHFLAGGLDPWNLQEAIAASGAPLVDVSSGVERGPGLKDPALIAAFLDAAKRA
ncbi:MAG: phosphoribosylanthranilate isomerase [Caulobacterales bacterium]|nr:phosphoribosylanthranilate isomerase [Caulobacterales bacterium]